MGNWALPGKCGSGEQGGGLYRMAVGTQKLSCPSSGEPGAVNWASAVQWDKPLPYVFGICRTSGESSSHQPQEQALQPCLF